MAPSITAVSLYSGAGGLDLGFLAAGVDILWANDSDALAVETYRENIGDHAVCGDVLSLEPPDCSPDLVIGGPPCQGFSVIGRMDPNDSRSRHVWHFLEVVEQLRPRAFVMENVKSLAAAPRWKPLRYALRHRAEALGYATTLHVLNASHYGVPQARERMFLVGILDGAPCRPPKPVTDGKPPTVREALATLPAFGEPGNNTVAGARVVPSQRPVMRPTAHAGSLLFNGSGRPLDLDRPAKTLPASMGGNATPIVDQLELAEGASPWVVEYHAHLMAGGAPLTSAPDRMRRITVEEAAALQTFPRGFRFCGQRVAQYRQIGNAVPPRLAEHVASAVVRAVAMAAAPVAA